MTDKDSQILELSIKKLSSAFNEFISECMDKEGQPKQPSISALMKARGYLPPYCGKSFKKKG